MCGEQVEAVFDIAEGEGSSPRVRGAAHVLNGNDLTYGIIPACAGSSSYVSDLFVFWRDHPRVCGEQLTRSPVARWPPGSSPRVRGAAFVEPRDADVSGIIPACAGSRAPQSAACA